MTHFLLMVLGNSYLQVHILFNYCQKVLIYIHLDEKLGIQEVGKEFKSTVEIYDWVPCLKCPYIYEWGCFLDF